MSEEQGVCCALIQFNEVKEVEDLIRDLPNVCAKTKDSESKTHMDFVLGNDFDFNFERYKKVLDYYQAQPHLIDPHLPGLLELLVDIINYATILSQVRFFFNNKAYWLPLWGFSSNLHIGITIYDTTLI